jgi:large subunit ribosomal protein L23
MALFGSKKNKEIKEEKIHPRQDTPSSRTRDASGSRSPTLAPRRPSENVSSPLSSTSPIIHRGQHHDIIIRPRITEKSGIMSENSSVYTFEVRKNANKPMIAQAIKALYKVTPTKVRIVNLPAKRVLVRGKRGTSNGVKKAMVYLKKGEKINLV